MNDDSNVTLGDEEIRDDDGIKKQLMEEGVDIEEDTVEPEEDEVEEEEEGSDEVM